MAPIGAIEPVAPATDAVKITVPPRVGAAVELMVTDGVARSTKVVDEEFAGVAAL
jgi:hypothetical protein